MSRSRDHRDIHYDGDYRASQQYFAGRDINLFSEGGIGAIQATGGIAKVFVLIGLLLSYAGAGMFFFVVGSFIVTIWSSMGSSAQPDMSGIAAMVTPWLPLGIGLLFAGNVIGGIALAVGKPRRR